MGALGLKRLLHIYATLADAGFIIRSNRNDEPFEGVRTKLTIRQHTLRKLLLMDDFVQCQQNLFTRVEMLSCAYTIAKFTIGRTLLSSKYSTVHTQLLSWDRYLF